MNETQNNKRMTKKATNLTKIVRIGNSKGIIVDPDTLNYLDLDLGDWVEYTIEKKKNEDKNNK